MTITRNCRPYNSGSCPFLKWPLFQSGFTGKSGPETWFYCKKTGQAIRHMQSCTLAGDSDSQVEAWKEYARGR